MFTVKIRCLQPYLDKKIIYEPIEVISQDDPYNVPLDKLEVTLKRLQEIILAVNHDHAISHSQIKSDDIKIEVVQ